MREKGSGFGAVIQDSKGREIAIVSRENYPLCFLGYFLGWREKREGRDGDR